MAFKVYSLNVESTHPYVRDGMSIEFRTAFADDTTVLYARPGSEFEVSPGDTISTDCPIAQEIIESMTDDDGNRFFVEVNDLNGAGIGLYLDRDVFNSVRRVPRRVLNMSEINADISSRNQNNIRAL